MSLHIELTEKKTPYASDEGILLQEKKVDYTKNVKLIK